MGDLSYCGKYKDWGRRQQLKLKNRNKCLFCKEDIPDDNKYCDRCREIRSIEIKDKKKLRQARLRKKYGL